ncbi:MAG: HAMP domain-containing sensor histidine kinase [Candidatus Krumholzibacteriia bacterium]
MSLRSRLILGSVLLVLLPLALLGVGVRLEMQRRLTDQFSERVETLMRASRDELAATSARLDRQLAALAAAARRDNALTLGATGQADARPYLLDWAGTAMHAAGLDLLQLRDHRGVILSSGHHRNEFDRRDPDLVGHLTATGAPALLESRQPDGEPFLVLARAVPVTLGGRLHHLVGGLTVDETWLRRLSPAGQLAVSIVYPGVAISSDPALAARFDRSTEATATRPLTVAALAADGDLVRVQTVPVIRPEGAATGLLAISHPAAPLRELQRSVDVWLLLAVALAAVGSLLLAVVVSDRVSRPLRDLAARTRRLDLDRLDVAFAGGAAGGRDDEVGQLARLLDELAARLRASLARARDAERRATLGEVARQVNHDVRNGLTPLRNVVRHLAEVAAAAPQDLARVFAERRGTLEAGLTHLEALAGHYRRLSVHGRAESCDLGAAARQAADALLGSPAGGRPGGVPVDLRVRVAAGLPPVESDPVSLRRILDNLLRNALESLADGGGRVEISVDRSPDGVVLTVADTGCGIPPADLERIFDDFYTTKPAGSGLGLSNVRRLVADAGGAVTVRSDPGAGSVFRVTFPVAREAVVTGERDS